MIIIFSTQPQGNKLIQFTYLRLTLPNDFSLLEIKQSFSFLKKYFQQNYGITIKPVREIPPSAKTDTKNIDLRHFYNYLSVVEIRKGVLDMDFDYDLSGLRGQILLFLQDDETESYFIQWSVRSFQHLSDQYLTELKANNLPWCGTFVACSDILPVNSSKILEPIDQILVNKYIETSSHEKFIFWEKKIIPLMDVYPSVFMIWEKMFSEFQNPIQLTYSLPEPNSPPITAAFHLTPAGSERINGVWVMLSGKTVFMLPLSQITNFTDPVLQQKLDFYHDWARIICPEI